MNLAQDHDLHGRTAGAISERMESSGERQHLLPDDDRYSDDVTRTRSYRAKTQRILSRYPLAAFLGMLGVFTVLVVLVQHGLTLNREYKLESQNIRSHIADQVRKSMNFSADPCSNFYEYACGGWIANATLPDDKDAYDRSFTQIYERNVEILHDIVKSGSSSGEDRVGTMWRSCMDESSIEAGGIEPFLDQIKSISAISSLNDLFSHLGAMERRITDFLFKIAVEVDSKDTSRYIVTVHQAGLTMGDRFRYVLSETNHTAELFEHFKRLHTLANLTLSQSEGDADTAIHNVVDLEVQIAQFTKPNEDLRDPIATFNLRSVQNCSDETGLDFATYLENMGFKSLSSTTHLNVENPDFLKKMGELLKSTALPVLKDAVVLRTLSVTSELLPRKFRDEHFRFFASVLRGIQEQQPRYKRCISVVDQLLGDDLGKRFLKNINFSEKQKQLAISIVNSVIDEFKASLSDVSWMDEATQKLAIAKLEKIKLLMGYPKTWTNYDHLQLQAGSFSENVLRTREFLTDDCISRLSQSVDPYRFQMSTPTVNAYYDPTLNSINFPAGILQLPFFTSEPSVPVAFNFGGIGTVIGHELVHAFDDQGRQYDGDGVLNPWWTHEVADRFKERSKCLGNQYASIDFPGGLHINPELTMGENIADNGGVSAAFKALLKSPIDDSTNELIPGITNRKLFWIAMAQNWCEIQTKEKLVNQLSTDPHSPPLARVHVPIMNNEEFAKDFQCRPGSDLNPDKRCIIW